MLMVSQISRTACDQEQISMATPRCYLSLLLFSASFCFKSIIISPESTSCCQQPGATIGGGLHFHTDSSGTPPDFTLVSLSWG